MVLLLFLLSGKLCAKRCRRMSGPNHGKQSGHECGSGSTPAPAVAEISVGATSGTTCSASGSFASDSVANSHLTLASAPARFFEPRCFLAKTRFETPSGGFLIVGVAISIPAAEARKRERGNLGKVESGDGIMGKQEDEKMEQQDGGKAETW